MVLGLNAWQACKNRSVVKKKLKIGMKIGEYTVEIQT